MSYNYYTSTCSIKFKKRDFGSLNLTSGPKGLVLIDSGISVAVSADLFYAEDDWYAEGEGGR